jgi:molybdopterin molybdotransferase
MISLDEALTRLVTEGRARAIRDVEMVATFDALGRVLAQDVRSMIDVPGADNAAMDGYALRVADLPQAGATLPVSQRIPAGAPGGPLLPGTAARIFTGAVVPEGADAVVMQEDAQAIEADGGGGPARVRINAVPASGQWIRRRGSDVREGDTVLARGQRLTPQALGLAAAVGAAQLAVVRRPRVAVFSTGDELAMPGEPLKPGGIYNSNRFTLRGLLQDAGCEVSDFGIVPDRLDATRDALRRAAWDSDLIVTSGGVSVGEEDHLRPAVLAEGRLDLWQVAIKPGKPLAFGAVRRGDAGIDDGSGGPGGEALFVGLPGNPVSVFVTFLVAVAPLLRALQGCATTAPRAIAVRADFDWPRRDPRREFLRGRLNDDGGVEIFRSQDSALLTSTVWADGLVDNPAGTAIARGDRVRFLTWAALLGG